MSRLITRRALFKGLAAGAALAMVPGTVGATPLSRVTHLYTQPSLIQPRELYDMYFDQETEEIVWLVPGGTMRWKADDFLNINRAWGFTIEDNA